MAYACNGGGSDTAIIATRPGCMANAITCTAGQGHAIEPMDT
jgi:hypothetical protein